MDGNPQFEENFLQNEKLLAIQDVKVSYRRMEAYY